MTFSIQLDRSVLQFGNVEIPLINATDFSVVSRECPRIDIQIRMRKYETTLRLFLETAENLNRCIGELAKCRTMRQKLPHIVSISQRIEDKTAGIDIQFKEIDDREDFIKYSWGWRGLDCKVDTNSADNCYVVSLSFNGSDQAMNLLKLRAMLYRLNFKFHSKEFSKILGVHTESDSSHRMEANPTLSRVYSVGKEGAFDPAEKLSIAPIRLPIPWEEVEDWIHHPKYQPPCQTTYERMETALRKNRGDRKAFGDQIQTALKIRGFNISRFFSEDSPRSSRQKSSLKVETS